MRILLICHVSAADRAVSAAREIWGYPRAGEDGVSGQPPAIDVLCYGRASDDFPAPQNARIIALPLQEGRSLRKVVALLGSIRRRHEVVALSQPSLGSSRARGLLLAFAYLLGGDRSVILDPAASRVRRRIRLRLAAIEAVRWVALQALSSVLASVAVPAISRLAEHPAPPRRIPPTGSAAYLRTDVDLRVAPLLAGGSVAHTEGILEALQAHGYTVELWSTGQLDGVPESVTQSSLPAIIKGNLPTEVAELLSGLWQGALSGRRPSPTAFIYQRYSLNNLAGVFLSRRWKVPLILEANDSEAKWRKDFSLLRFPRLAFACERLILRNATVIAAVSTNAAEDLLAAGATARRLRIIPNGVSAKRFAGATPMQLPQHLEGFVICFAGLFYPWHGVRFLAEAFARFHTNCPAARLLLVGDGEERPVVRALLERSGSLGAAHFTGLVPRSLVPRYLAAADVLVSPHANIDHFIGSPIKVFEYMAAGKAIVATRVGQLQEVLSDERTALLVPPEDPEAMAQAFHRLHSDPELRAALGTTAQAEAHAKHSWDSRLDAILAAACDGSTMPDLITAPTPYQ